MNIDDSENMMNGNVDCGDLIMHQQYKSVFRYHSLQLSSLVVSCYDLSVVL